MNKDIYKAMKRDVLKVSKELKVEYFDILIKELRRKMGKCNGSITDYENIMELHSIGLFVYTINEEG